MHVRRDDGKVRFHSCARQLLVQILGESLKSRVWSAGGVRATMCRVSLASIKVFSVVRPLALGMRCRWAAARRDQHGIMCSRPGFLWSIPGVGRRFRWWKLIRASLGLDVEDRACSGLSTISSPVTVMGGGCDIHAGTIHLECVASLGTSPVRRICGRNCSTL